MSRAQRLPGVLLLNKTTYKTTACFNYRFRGDGQEYFFSPFDRASLYAKHQICHQVL